MMIAEKATDAADAHVAIHDCVDARSLRPAIVGTVEHLREQWALELVEYDHAGNDNESADSSCQASLVSVVSVSVSGGKRHMPCFACFACVVPSVARD